jgi:hypothetical protein
MVVTAAVICCLFAGGILSCKSGVPQKVYERPQARCRILITGTTSEFKEAVVAGLVERYRETCQIEMRPATRIDEDEFNDYDAIVLMDECHAWMAFNTRTLGLVRRIAEKERIILFITAGDPDWTFSTQGIDAVTSASKMARRGEVIEEIAARIDALIG